MISPSVESRMRAALAQLQAEAEQLELAVAESSGLADRAWQFLTGTESTASAAAETARQARKAVDEMQPRFAALVADPTATDGQGEQFIADAQARSGVGASLAAAQQVGAAEGVKEVAKGTAEDIAAALPSLSQVKWWAIAIGGALLLGLGLYAYAKAKG